MIVLIGFMGAGKSTVGKKLARRMNLPFADSDDLIEAATGKTIPDIFASVGEPGFRDIEEKTIIEALAGREGVLALGGGSLASTKIREALPSHTVVWINIDYAEALRRIGDDPNRPVLHSANLHERFVERRKIYEAAADISIEVDNKTSARVTEAILSLLAPEILPTSPDDSEENEEGEE